MNWCFWTVVLEKTLESPLNCKEIQPVHSEGDQPWVFFGRNDAKAETPVPRPPHVKSWLIGKDSDAGRDWGQEEKGTPEDEMAGWHHRLDGREFEWTLGVGDGQGGLACCDSWGRKESDTTERLNWTELWSPCCTLDPQNSVLLQLIVYILTKISSFSPPCKPLEPPVYFVSMSLAFLGSTCKWDYIVFVLSPVFLRITILTDVNDISW